MPGQETREAAPSSAGDSEQEQPEKARLEAQRLELMAERARLESERAQLVAERKRLELEKFKTLREHSASVVAERQAAKYPKPEGATKEGEEASGTQSAGSAVSGGQAVNGDKSSLRGRTPPFAPQSITDIMGAEFPRVSEADIRMIQDKVCGMKTFFVTEVDRSPFDERVVFRGNLRLEKEKALEELERLADSCGLSKRVRLFLLLDPKDSDTDKAPTKPVLVALPAAASPSQTGVLSTILALVASAVTVGTSLTFGISIFGFTPAFMEQVAKGNVDEFYYTLPISLGVFALAIAHDLGHRVMAKVRGLKLGLPYFIPSLQVGTFGTITPLEDYPRSRKQLFDVSIAGPISGIVCSMATLVAGLVFTSSGAVADWFPQVPSALFHASILIGGLTDVILPAALREQATLAVHPLTVIGYTGMLVNALNLMPIGRLDGGRIVQALYGRASASRISAITLVLQGLSSVFGNSPLLLFWGLICVFLQRESDFPCQNELIEPDDTRSAIGLMFLFLMLSVLIPFPDQLGDILGRY